MATPPAGAPGGDEPAHPIDPRIPRWIAEDCALRKRLHAEKLAALGASMTAAREDLLRRLIAGEANTSDALLASLRTTIGAAEKLRELRGAEPCFVDCGLGVLSVAKPAKPLVATQRWLLSRLSSSSRLVQLVAEGKYTATVRNVRFKCRVRMGGYKYRDIEDVEDMEMEPEFHPPLVLDSQVVRTFDKFLMFGGFNKIRRRAVDYASTYSDSIFDQGEEWDTMSEAYVWGRYSVVVFCPAELTLGPAAETHCPKGGPEIHAEHEADPGSDDGTGDDNPERWWMAED